MIWFRSVLTLCEHALFLSQHGSWLYCFFFVFFKAFAEALLFMFETIFAKPLSNVIITSQGGIFSCQIPSINIRALPIFRSRKSLLEEGLNNDHRLCLG